jgi:hypothetical protein
MQHCIKPRSKLHSIKSENFRPGAEIHLHFAAGKLSFGRADYHSCAARLSLALAAFIRQFLHTFIPFSPILF